MTEPFSWDACEAWPLSRIIEALETTPEESWATDVVRTSDGRNCLFGHLFDIGGGESGRGGSRLIDYFESVFASTFMVYPVNDGKHRDYQQPTPKQRCIAYLRDIESGVQPSSHDLWVDMIRVKEAA